eukprot:RCo036704
MITAAHRPRKDGGFIWMEHSRVDSLIEQQEARRRKSPFKTLDAERVRRMEEAWKGKASKSSMSLPEEEFHRSRGARGGALPGASSPSAASSPGARNWELPFRQGSGIREDPLCSVLRSYTNPIPRKIFPAPVVDHSAAGATGGSSS